MLNKTYILKLTGYRSFKSSHYGACDGIKRQHGGTTTLSLIIKKIWILFLLFSYNILSKNNRKCPKV